MCVGVFVCVGCMCKYVVSVCRCICVCESIFVWKSVVIVRRCICVCESMCLCVWKYVVSV